MEKYIGKSVYKGTAIGPVSVLKKKDSLVKRIHIDNTEEELKRLDAAKERTMTQLGQLYEKALQEVGEVNAAIFEVHQMMLEDDDYQDAIHSMIQNEEVNAEYAVAVTGDNFAEMFANMDDEYMQARSADVRDISNRLVRNLSGEEQIDWSTMEPSIIVADDLTPSETVQMDKSKILAFVTVHGSTNSHTAILARMMNIPALIGVPLELEKIHNGTRAIVDGREAVFYLDPEEEQIRQAEAAQQTEQRLRSLLAEYKGRESVTKSGRKVNVYANIGSVSDVAYVLENDAEGIGLFRSEFLYLGRDSLPDETEQFNAYRQVLQMMAGKKIPVNTGSFTNDMTTFRTEDDVLTLLIHLGYLGYEEQNKYVFIPNAEVQSEYASAVTVSQWGDISKALKNSADLLQAVWEKQETQVAEGIRLAHFETSQLQYNDENALSYTISLALYAARNFYTVYRELPGGKGFADLVFVPRKRYQDKPALVVELKWDKTAEGALAQIKDKEYCRSLEEYQGNLLLVGINYDVKTKEHSCVIEEFVK